MLLEIGSTFALRYFPAHHQEDLPPEETGLQLFLPSNGPLAFDVRRNFTQRLRRHEFDTTVHTNAQGFRENAEVLPHPDLACMGDSFAFGWGVEVGERFCDLLGNAKRFATYAWPNGNFPGDYYLFLKAHPELVPRDLVVSLFLGNDLTTDPAERTFVADERGRLVSARRREAPKPPLLRGYLSRSHFAGLLRIALGRWSSDYVPTFFSHQKLGTLPAVENGELDLNARLALDHLVWLRKDLLPTNTRLRVVLIPEPYRLWPHPLCPYKEAVCARWREKRALPRAVIAYLGSHGIGVIDTSEALISANHEAPVYFPWDGHLTPRGHSVVAARAEGLSRPDSAP